MPSYYCPPIDYDALVKRRKVYEKKLRGKGIIEGGSKWMVLMGRARRAGKF